MPLVSLCRFFGKKMYPVSFWKDKNPVFHLRKIQVQPECGLPTYIADPDMRSFCLLGIACALDALREALFHGSLCKAVNIRHKLPFQLGKVF